MTKNNKEETQLQPSKLNDELAKKKEKKKKTLSTKWQKYIGQKGMRNKEVVETIYIRGLPNFNNYYTFNQVEIKIDANKILSNLYKYVKGDCKHHFLVNELTFSSGIKNDASILFTTFNGLNDAHDSVTQ